MNPEEIMEYLIEELHGALVNMSKAKKLEAKKQYSEIVKNLSESLGVFFNVANNLMLEDIDEEFDEDEYDEYDDEDDNF